VNVLTNITWADAKPDWQYQVQATYNYGQIGNTTDSFERSQLGSDYTTGGNAPWTISTQFALVGNRSARAGVITHNQTSWMTRSAGPGSLSFWYYLSSEANADYFNFYIDSARMVHAAGTGGGWVQYANTLGAGQHELKWEYAKNASGSSGYDSVWVDYLQLVADNTAWSDVVALTPPGAASAAWTPTTISHTCKVRVRSYHADGSYGPWGESDTVFSVAQISFPVGDLNCDGAVNNFDISPFVLALNDPALYAATYPTCNRALADVNGDGRVDNFDITPFVALLTSP
jgi:hypothetical protein